ncbi:MAG: DUF1501 domain-containing protein [Blastocatellia bacterium]|nr:DUF1501 domain-containing protein [Blastocatellia bacterium]
MPTKRRDFIKQGIGLAAVSLVLPRVWLTEARGRTAAPNRKVFVVVGFSGGNDGLNTVIPYTDSRYSQLRPTLALKESDLKDAQERSTIISDRFGLHPSLGAIKGLYDQNRVAIVHGAGLPAPNLSHFDATRIWYTARAEGGRGAGWLGRYVDAVLAEPEMPALSVTSFLPGALSADERVIPAVPAASSSDPFFGNSLSFQTDPAHPGDRPNRIKVLGDNNRRSFPEESFQSHIAATGQELIRSAEKVNNAVLAYESSVVYPSGSNFASAMQMAAQAIIGIPELSLVYVTLGGFDTHARQKEDHALLLQNFSEATKSFYDDMAEHGMEDVLMMQFSEFGRRPMENKSLGTDHGTASTMFVIGKAVRGGIYGEQPSLEAAALDDRDNLKTAVDFRSVYATILDGFLDIDSESILGERFENIGFLG